MEGVCVPRFRKWGPFLHGLDSAQQSNAAHKQNAVTPTPTNKQTQTQSKSSSIREPHLAEKQQRHNVPAVLLHRTHKRARAADAQRRWQRQRCNGTRDKRGQQWAWQRGLVIR